MRAVARCGTPSGYRKHQSNGEKPCPACTAAKQEYDRRWRQAGDREQRSRISARAQNLARGELARRHKAEYDALYASIRDAAFAEAGLLAKQATP